MIIGFSHPLTSRGIFLHNIGSLKTVPPKIFLIVPFGDFHIFLSLNSDKNIKFEVEFDSQEMTCIT